VNHRVCQVEDLTKDSHTVRTVADRVSVGVYRLDAGIAVFRI